MLLRREAEVRIVEIALLPSYRSRGIGTGLLRPLIEEASRSGLNLTIHVEQMNPALSLYERLGFKRVGEAGIYHKMQRAPGAFTTRTS
jgi:ribosomal protein S18 acetylase RimI-like enzyme